jgi:hypothetical protein
MVLHFPYAKQLLIMSPFPLVGRIPYGGFAFHLVRGDEKEESLANEEECVKYPSRKR